MMMSVKAEQHTRSSLVNSCFDQVAKIDFVKNKWITAEAWFKLIKKEIPNCILNDITLVQFKNYLIKHGQIVPNSVFSNAFGYYCCEGKLNLDGMYNRNKRVTCFLATSPILASSVNLLKLSTLPKYSIHGTIQYIFYLL